VHGHEKNPVISSLVVALALREGYRNDYWRNHDPILDDRLLWRAQTFRHTVHLLPGQKILELGCGELQLTRALLHVSRRENPITAVTFQKQLPDLAIVDSKVEVLQLSHLPGPLAGRHFDCIIAMDLLDRNTSSELLAIAHDLLAPGGEIVFYESNPWNPVHKLRDLVLRLVGRRDPRNLISRPRLYELLSEIGFVRVYAVFNDFVFTPLTRPLIWFLRNASILLENAPLVRTMAGSILVHAQKPPRVKEAAQVSLFGHPSLRHKVSVVIPCRNEEMNVGPLVKRVLELYGEYIHEIIAVNDGSSDRTGEVLCELAAKNARVKPLHRTPPNGVGLAIAEGLSAATGDYVFTMDCDFQHLLPEFRDMLDAAAEGCDVVIGSRFSRHSVLLNYPFMKILANRAFHALAVILFARRIRDVTNNLKIMRREVVSNLLLQQAGFAVNAETGLQPLVLGYSIKQVPISWINRTPGMGMSSFRLARVGGGYWSVLIGLWLRYVFGVGPYRKLGRAETTRTKGRENVAPDKCRL
jgi:dolichol-phosphate mannosyltransferase